MFRKFIECSKNCRRFLRFVSERTQMFAKLSQSVTSGGTGGVEQCER